MECTLEPKTRHGKNKIAEVKSVDPLWNGRWQAVSTADRVNFAPGKRGPWFLLVPLCTHGPFEFMRRWVHGADDENFTMRSNSGIKPDRQRTAGS